MSKKKVLDEKDDAYYKKKQEEYGDWKSNKLDDAKDGKIGYQPIFNGFANKMKESKVTINPIIVYFALCEIAGNFTGAVFVSNEKITEICGIKGSSLSDALTSLEEKGFIERFNTRNRYGKLERKIVLKPY